MSADTSAFLSPSEAAALLGVDVGTVTKAIDGGRLPALQLTEHHRGTRIPMSALFPDEATTRDLKLTRIRRLTAAVLRARDETARKQAAAHDAEEELHRAIRALEDELALHDMDAARAALRQAG